MANDHFAHIEDKELLQKYYHDGSNQWLGLLLQRYTLLLFGVCMKYLKNEEDAKDAVQQIFLKAITEINKYKVEYFKSWIYMVAKNHCLMRLRDKQGKIPVELTDEIAVQPAEETDYVSFIEKDTTLNAIEQSLPHLNPEQQQCVTLFYLEKQSYQQISETTGYSLMQVKSFIQNGKRNLKQLVIRKLNP